MERTERQWLEGLLPEQRDETPGTEIRLHYTESAELAKELVRALADTWTVRFAYGQNGFFYRIGVGQWIRITGEAPDEEPF